MCHGRCRRRFGLLSQRERAPLTFVHPQPDTQKETVIEIKRKFGRAKPVVYQITDKPPPKKSPVRRTPLFALALSPEHNRVRPGLGKGGGSARAGLRVAAEGVSVQGTTRSSQA